mmetsp:Transcript_26184/g.73244  ORF Transcript_26184/g.73244 Transcript_26184/m.73244 type:complete len:256 (+) Transcript_26184:1172-1939(+)
MCEVKFGELVPDEEGTWPDSEMGLDCKGLNRVCELVGDGPGFPAAGLEALCNWPPTRLRAANRAPAASCACLAASIAAASSGLPGEGPSTVPLAPPGGNEELERTDADPGFTFGSCEESRLSAFGCRTCTEPLRLGCWSEDCRLGLPDAGDTGVTADRGVVDCAFAPPAFVAVMAWPCVAAKGSDVSSASPVGVPVLYADVVCGDGAGGNDRLVFSARPNSKPISLISSTRAPPRIEITCASTASSSCTAARRRL